MRSPFLLYSGLFLLTACSVSSVNVLERKETPKPFAKIMTVYIDGDIDFAVFDSLTYNICIRPAFQDTGSLFVRSNTETLLSDGLASPRSAIVRSTDFFGLDMNSFAGFNAEMDSLGVDAVLLIHRHRYTHKLHELSPAFSEGSPVQTYMPTRSHSTPNGAFACYLFKPHEYLPVWKGEIEVKGKGYNGDKMMNPAMVVNLEKSLVAGGYLTPHRQ